MHKSRIALAVLAFIAAGCATKPEDIAPAYVDERAYQPLSCEQLASEETRVKLALAKNVTWQNEARSTDALSIVFMGLPASSFSQDVIGEKIAHLKGEQIALQKQIALKNCGAVPAAPAVAPAPATPAATAQPAAATTP